MGPSNLPKEYQKKDYLSSTNILVPPPYMSVQDAYTYFAIKEKEARSLIARREICASRGPGGRIWKIETASVYKYLKKYRSNREESNGI